MNATPSAAAARPAVDRLRQSCRTVALATSSAEGRPEASVAPAAFPGDGSVLIYVSGLAAHTRHLLATGRAGVLLAEDEAAAADPLARVRLTLSCRAAEVARGTPEFAAGLDALAGRLGASFALIRDLADFRLFRLQPEEARLVLGFGRALRVNPTDWGEVVES